MCESYKAITAEIQEAGFFVTTVEPMGRWDRITVCSKRRAQGGYTGNSFWITKLPDGWYLGMWGGSRYRFPEERQVACFCIEWLTREPDKTRGDIEPDIMTQFGLIEISDEEFERMLESL